MHGIAADSNRGRLAKSGARRLQNHSPLACGTQAMQYRAPPVDSRHHAKLSMPGAVRPDCWGQRLRLGPGAWRTRTACRAREYVLSHRQRSSSALMPSIMAAAAGGTSTRLADRSVVSGLADRFKWKIKMAPFCPAPRRRRACVGRHAAMKVAARPFGT
jgi:hypothetical protein